MVTLEGNSQDIASVKADVAFTKARIEAVEARIWELPIEIARTERSLTVWAACVSLGFTVVLASILIPLLLMILDRLPKYCGWG